MVIYHELWMKAIKETKNKTVESLYGTEGNTLQVQNTRESTGDTKMTF